MARSTTRRAHGYSIYKRKDGRFEGAITVGTLASGNPKRVRVYGQTETEVIKRLEEVKVNLHLGKPAIPDKKKLGDFLDLWLDTVIKPQKAPSTYRYYEQLSRLYIKPVIGNVALGAVGAQHVQSLINEWSKPRKKGEKTLPPLKAHTINGIRSTLRSALSVAWKWNLIPENPCFRVSPVKQDQEEVEFLTPEEVRSLLEASRGHYLENLVEFALLTGVRLGEALGLRWDDVDTVDSIVRIRVQLQRFNNEFSLRPPKSSSGRRVLALTQRALDLLEDQKGMQLLWSADNPDEFNPLQLVFTGTDGRPLYQKNVGVILKAMAKKAGIKKNLSFHKLRHTLATHLAAQGTPLSTLKDVLGHSQISVTVNTYGHAVPNARRQAAEAIQRIYEIDDKGVS